MATGLAVVIPHNDWVSHLLEPLAGTYLRGPLSADSLAAGLSTTLRLAAGGRAERASAKGITTVVFDRGGYMFHGRVKALAAAAREGGLKF